MRKRNGVGLALLPERVAAVEGGIELGFGEKGGDSASCTTSRPRPRGLPRGAAGLALNPVAAGPEGSVRGRLEVRVDSARQDAEAVDQKSPANWAARAAWVSSHSSAEESQGQRRCAPIAFELGRTEAEARLLP